jgi:hypothetical protein
MDVERRLDELGLTLPEPAVLPAGVDIPFAWVCVRGNRAFVSDHGALAADGSPAGPFGKVPSEVTLQEAAQIMKHFDQGDCMGMHRACVCSTPPQANLGRETAGCRLLASAPPCLCCVRTG